MLDKIFSKLERFVPLKYRWILNHAGFKRYFKNTGWMFGGQMFSLLVSFFIGAWIARYLGPENYGILSYSVAFVGLFGFIASFGVDGILSRELVKFPENRDNLLGTAFRLKLIGGVIAFLLAVTGAFIFQSDPLIKLLIILFSFTFILQSLNVISIYFQAEVKSRNNVTVILVATLISSFLKVSVILLDKGIIWIVIIYTLDFLWQGIGFIRAYNKFGLRIGKWKFNRGLAREILKSSWLLMLASAAGAIYLKIDLVMIGAILGNYEVGLYSAAVKLVEVWYFIPGIICASLFPAIVNAKKTDILLYKRRLNNLYFLMIAISFIIAIPITLLAKPVILILFGTSYIASVNILKIYIWSNFGLFLGTAAYQFLITENKITIIFIITALAMTTNIGLNLIFIPMFGLIGAAWATLISYLVVPLGAIYGRKINSY